MSGATHLHTVSSEAIFITLASPIMLPSKLCSYRVEGAISQELIPHCQKVFSNMKGVSSDIHNAISGMFVLPHHEEVTSGIQSRKIIDQFYESFSRNNVSVLIAHTYSGRLSHAFPYVITSRLDHELKKRFFLWVADESSFGASGPSFLGVRLFEFNKAPTIENFLHLTCTIPRRWERSDFERILGLHALTSIAMSAQTPKTCVYKSFQLAWNILLLNEMSYFNPDGRLTLPSKAYFDKQRKPLKVQFESHVLSSAFENYVHSVSSDNKLLARHALAVKVADILVAICRKPTRKKALFDRLLWLVMSYHTDLSAIKTLPSNPLNDTSELKPSVLIKFCHALIEGTLGKEVYDEFTQKLTTAEERDEAQIEENRWLVDIVSMKKTPHIVALKTEAGSLSFEGDINRQLDLARTHRELIDVEIEGRLNFTGYTRWIEQLAPLTKEYDKYLQDRLWVAFRRDCFRLLKTLEELIAERKPDAKRLRIVRRSICTFHLNQLGLHARFNELSNIVYTLLAKDLRPYFLFDGFGAELTRGLWKDLLAKSLMPEQVFLKEIINGKTNRSAWLKSWLRADGMRLTPSDKHTRSLWPGDKDIYDLTGGPFNRVTHADFETLFPYPKAPAPKPILPFHQQNNAGAGSAPPGSALTHPEPSVEETQ